MKSIYLDTSIPSAYYNKRHLERLRVTRHVWQYEFPKYNLMISNITISELSATKKKKNKRKFLALVKNMNQVMTNDATLTLSEEYQKVLPIPKNDSLHIAIATIHNCDILLSWNFTHMANYHYRTRINGINLINGYNEIQIISPYELIGGQK